MTESATPIVVRPLVSGDEREWRPLFEAYCRFYKVEPSAEKSATVWRWLMDPAHGLKGLGARAPGGSLIGIAHVRPVPRTLSGAEGGFLDDLFVEPSMRGGGAADALMRAIAAYARERNWTNVRWITADDNYRARRLYDRLARKTPWNTYELDPSDPRLN